MFHILLYFWILYHLLMIATQNMQISKLRALEIMSFSTRPHLMQEHSSAPLTGYPALNAPDDRELSNSPTS